MGIHYDYKSTRGEKAMKKRQRKKHEQNKEEPEKSNIENVKEDKMHDIDKPITPEDLTNPEKN